MDSQKEEEKVGDYMNDWLSKNKEALESVKRGLQQKGNIYRGSFAKYIKGELYKIDTETVTDIATKYLKG